MSNSMSFDNIDFTNYGQASKWVKNLLTEHGGIYLTETFGTMNVWLINPTVLLELPPEIGWLVADTMDRLLAEIIPQHAISAYLSRMFTGRKTDVSTIIQIQSVLHQQFTEFVDLPAVFHQLEAVLVHAIYDLAESR